MSVEVDCSYDGTVEGDLRAARQLEQVLDNGAKYDELKKRFDVVTADRYELQREVLHLRSCWCGLRPQFAAMMAAGLLTHPVFTSGHQDEIADEAVKLTDALLARLQRK